MSERVAARFAFGDVHPAWLGELVDDEQPGYRLTHRADDLPGTLLTAANSGGELAAFVMAVIGRRARQYGPVVLPGHPDRLGLWVNAALLQRLREVYPHVDEVESIGAEGDSARLHLGFQPL